MRPGIEVLADTIGDGQPVRRHEWYQFRLRMWLHRGDPVHWSGPWGSSPARLEDGGATLVTYFRYDREHLISGLFYGCEGMNVGGIRKLQIAPHMAYRDVGVPGCIPPNALITCEVAILAEGYPS